MNKAQTRKELARKLSLVLELERDKRIELRNALIKSEERVLELLLERAALEKRVRELERRNFELELERILYRSENAPRSRYDYDYDYDYESEYESEDESESESESEYESEDESERNYKHYDEPRPKAREKRQDHWSRSDLRGGHARGRKRRATIRDYRLGWVLIRDKNRCRDENPKPSGWRARQGWRGFIRPRLTKRQRAEREFEYVPEPYLPFARRADGLPVPYWAQKRNIPHCAECCETLYPPIEGDLCWKCAALRRAIVRRHDRAPQYWSPDELERQIESAQSKTFCKLLDAAMRREPGSVENLASYWGRDTWLVERFITREIERRFWR